MHSKKNEGFFSRSFFRLRKPSLGEMSGETHRLLL
jgi:hypothetical protein